MLIHVPDSRSYGRERGSKLNRTIQRVPGILYGCENVRSPQRMDTHGKRELPGF